MMKRSNFLFLAFLLLLTACGGESPETVPPATDEGAAEEVLEDTPTAPETFRDIEDDPIDRSPLTLVAKQVVLQKGDTFHLNLPEQFSITPAAEGLRRVRFMTQSPDGRLFVTGLHALYDNKKGKVFILDDFDEATGKFGTVATWEDKLHNPNSLQFYTDADGQDWLYLALTGELRRYKYEHGEMEPAQDYEVIATFPDYGLDYKHGGWHLTRTIAVHNDKIYVSVGSSCNACEELAEERVRASIIRMDPDGSNVEWYAEGMRNAVDIQWIEGQLYASNQAADHMGADMPEDAFFKVEEGKHYGWPYCYEYEGQRYADTTKPWKKSMDCGEMPLSYVSLGAHVAPLGFEYFAGFNDAAVNNYFLLANHGSGKVSLGRGYSIDRFKSGTGLEPVINGFLQDGERYGRPCDLHIRDENSFFFTDDHKGVVYFVAKK